MTAQIAVGQIQCLLEEAEICPVGLGEDGKYAEANPLMDRVIEVLGWMGSGHFRAWILIPATMPARAAPNDKLSAG